MTVFTAAVLQMRSGLEPHENAASLTELVREAAGQGATYLQTPEMTGMLQRDRAELAARLRAPAEDVIVRTASEVAGACGVFLHIGSLAVALADGKVANRSFLFRPDGSLAASYDKIHMFDVDLDNGESWRESRTYTAGGAARLADLAFPDGKVRLGFSICYDLRFPHLYRQEALAGAEVLTVPAAFTRQTGEAHWHVLLRARAIENGAFVVAAAQGGRHQDGRQTYGHSLIVDPWGVVLAEVAGDEPGIAVARIDTRAVAEARGKIPNLNNSRDFSVCLKDAEDESAEAAE